MIKTEYLQAIIAPTQHVLKAVTGVSPAVERVQVVSTIPIGHNLCVGLGLTGEADGGIYVIVDRAAACTIATKMMGKKIEDEASEEVFTALLELVNMIAGNAVGLLIKSGLRVGITVPSLYSAAPEPPEGASQALVVMNSELGSVKIGVSIATGGR